MNSFSKKYLFCRSPFLEGLCLLCFFFALRATAQQPVVVQLLPVSPATAEQLRVFDVKPFYKDSLSALNALQAAVAKLRKEAWLEASVDSFTYRSDTLKAWVYSGPRYEWVSLRNGGIPDEFLSKSGFREKLFKGKTFNFQELAKIEEQLLKTAENNGYPFAAVYLDSIFIAEGKVQACLMLDKGEAVFWDSLQVSGDVKISNTYLSNYLGIKKGEPYSRKTLLKSKDRLRDLPFLREKQNVQVTFTGQQADLRFFLEKKKASRFDFLLGLLPDNTRPERKLILTGTFNTELLNAFGRGERLMLAFERLRPQTQKLDLAFSYPYLLDLPFGVEASFHQFKLDSSYTDITGNIGVQYLLQGGNYLKTFWNSTASNLIEVDTASLAAGKAPDQLDVTKTDFGLELLLQRLDYRYNPRKGFSILLRGSAGNRRIRRNQAILNISESFYDTLPERSFRFVAEGHLQAFLPLSQRSTLMSGLKGAWLISEDPIYRNEQYRIGGSRQLRGFDEESIFATAYAIFTLEYRLLTGQNSYFYTFADGAWLKDSRAGQPTRYDRPLGFGAGMTFETSAGIFSLGLAFGKRKNAPADFQNPKVHFGYVSLF